MYSINKEKIVGNLFDESTEGLINKFLPKKKVTEFYEKNKSICDILIVDYKFLKKYPLYFLKNIENYVSNLLTYFPSVVLYYLEEYKDDELINKMDMSKEIVAEIKHEFGKLRDFEFNNMLQNINSIKKEIHDKSDEEKIKSIVYFFRKSSELTKKMNTLSEYTAKELNSIIQEKFEKFVEHNKKDFVNQSIVRNKLDDTSAKIIEDIYQKYVLFVKEKYVEIKKVISEINNLNLQEFSKNIEKLINFMK